MYECSLWFLSNSNIRPIKMPMETLKENENPYKRKGIFIRVLIQFPYCVDTRDSMQIYCKFMMTWFEKQQYTKI